VTIGQEASCQLVDLEDEQIVVAPVRIGSNATVDIRASVGGGAEIEEGGYLAALSSLPSGARLRRGERWDGVPAAPAGRSPEAPSLDRVARSWPPVAHGAAMLVTRICSTLLLPAMASLAAAWMIHTYDLDAAALDAWLAKPFFDGRAMLLVAAAALATAPLTLAIQLMLIACSAASSPVWSGAGPRTTSACGPRPICSAKPATG
jgi:hypothetical protein